jgi:hypothetical protein
MKVTGFSILNPLKMKITFEGKRATKFYQTGLWSQ